MSTKDPFSMSNPTSLSPTPNVISSPVSAAGATPCDSRVLPIIEKFGLEAVLASLSPSQALAAGLLTTAISGRSGTTSSRSAALQQSLENRLRPLLNGSPERNVIWKKWITPWGAFLSKPRAAVRRNYEIVIGLWPTLTANAKATEAYNEAGNSAGQVALRKIIVTLWPAATANNYEQKDLEALKARRAECKQRTQNGNGFGMTLGNQVQEVALACWPASAARDWKGAKASQQTMERNSRPLNEMVLSCWSTLRATDGEKGGPNQSFGAGGSPLPSQVSAAFSSLSAPTESGGGYLHPEFAGWEMEYPPEWLSCAPLAMRSSRKSRRNSSRQP